MKKELIVMAGFKPASTLLAAGFALALAFTISCSSDDGDPSDGGGSCAINGKTVTIGSQVWMAENLNCDVSGSKCYDNDPANCAKYGRLYDWKTAMSVCPSGWHLPSDAEWTTLKNFVGSSAGTKLKAASGWNSGGNGTDEFGFAALPGGRGKSDGSFGGVGKFGNWWSSTEITAGGADVWEVNYDDGSVYWGDGYDKKLWFSVRCLQD